VSNSSPIPSQDVIRIMCPNLACKRVLAVPTHARGKLVRCRSCGINIRIPQPKQVEAPAAEDAGKSSNSAKPGANAPKAKDAA
jgi:hypothetical protein